MSNRSAFSVGMTVLLAVVAVVAAGLWLGEVNTGAHRDLVTARFRTVGGVGVGDPVVLRGVRVGRVEAIRLAPDDWVETDLRLAADSELPTNPVAIAASASLFGEWQLQVVAAERAPDDPGIRAALLEAAAVGDGVWPGATLPDIGELTAQASRIAGDIALVTDRVEGLIDSATISDVRQSVVALKQSAERLAEFTERQASSLEQVVANAEQSSGGMVRATGHMEATLSRIDSSTSSGELSAMVTDARAAAAELLTASSDFRLLTEAASAERGRLVEILTATDDVLGRLARGEGTLGMLSADSTLYREATLTVVQLRTLLADIQANPRRYFRFSVF
jgi:phospholipid/cholesterol/gamma-HCH transport system substrate-binding protein